MGPEMNSIPLGSERRREAAIPAGILRSQQAYWRDLPLLLKRRSSKRRWVAYHGDNRIGFADTSAELYHEFLHQRGLRKDEIYVDRVEPRGLPPWEAEDIDAPFSSCNFVTEPADDS
jgi:hypothetical protein